MALKYKLTDAEGNVTSFETETELPEGDVVIESVLEPSGGEAIPQGGGGPGEES